MVKGNGQIWNYANIIRVSFFSIRAMKKLAYDLADDNGLRVSTQHNKNAFMFYLFISVLV